MDVNTPNSMPEPGQRCPACGAARIAHLAERCYRCGVMMPPDKEAVLRLGLKPFWIIMGGMYVGLFGFLIPMLSHAPGLIIWVALMATFAFACWLTTNERSAQRNKTGKPLTWNEWFLLFLSYLGVPMVVMLVLTAVAFACFSICSLVVGIRIG